MLVASPAEAEPTTATTPTPIGCKLLKINLLLTRLSLRCRFERCAFYVIHIKRQHLFEMVAGAGFEPTTFGL